MQPSRHIFNLYKFQQGVFPLLLGWALSSIVAGIFWWRSQNKATAGFGSQFVGWGVINAILALFALKSAGGNLERQAQGEISLAEHTRQAQSFERLILLNAGLDFGYIAAGAWLGTKSPKRSDKLYANRILFRKGMGWGIVAQGSFLLIWDILLALLVHKRRNE
jgi:hypothetical protein